MTDEGDWVFDPFIGVGTTAIAALIHKRKAIGAEIIPEYIKIARDRIKQAEMGALRIRPMERTVYDPEMQQVNIPPKYVHLRKLFENLEKYQSR
jgi:adenine-specific DNA-methyltransferase